MNIKSLNIKSLLSSNDRSSKAKRQILLSILFKALSIVIGLVYIPLMLHCLDKEKYGVWLTLVSIFGWLGFFDIGLGNGLRNKLAETFARNERAQGKTYISTTYFLLVCIFSTILVAFHISNYFIDWNTVLNTKHIAAHELYLLTSIVFTFVIVRFVVQLITVIYKANQQSAVSDIIDSLSNTISFTIVLLISYTSQKDNLVLLGSSISVIPVLLFLGVSIIAFRGKYKDLCPNFKSINIQSSKGILSLGGKFFFLQITAIILFTSGNFIVTQFYGPEEVVIYSIAIKYFQIPIMGYSILASPLWTAATDAYYKNDFDWLRSTMKKLNQLTLVFAIGIAIMVLLSDWAYKIWFGSTVQIPHNLSYLASLYSLTFIVLIPYSYFLNGFGKIRLTVYLTLLELTTFVILIFVFGSIFNSSISVVLSFLGSRIYSLIFQPIQMHKILNKSAQGIWNQ